MHQEGRESPTAKSESTGTALSVEESFTGLPNLARSELITSIGPYPEVRPSHTRVAFEPNLQERMAQVKAMAADSFAAAVNPEVNRLSGYYQACSDWLNYSLMAHAIAKHLGIDDTQYQELLKEHRSITPRVYDALKVLALSRGVAEEELNQISESATQVNLNLIARQRMLLGRSILNSTPLLMRDPFAGGKAGDSYGFGDGKSAQIFEGKAEIFGLKFSAIASPRVHRDKEAGKAGYVLRYAVCNTPGQGYNEHNPAFILDNAVVDNIEAWHTQNFPSTKIETNPLLSSLADVLNTSVHDWIHSWFLYDVNAQTPEFKQWGSDIFHDVPHLLQNKLLINYELMCLSMQRNTWAMIFEANPQAKEERYQSLKNYLEQVDSFSGWLEEQSGDAQLADEQKDYLAYVALSNIILVLDPKEPRLSETLSSFPYAKAQIERILGDCANLVHSDLAGVPSQAQSGELEVTSEYIARSPLELEAAARVRLNRYQDLLGDPTSDDLAKNFMAHVKAFEMLPLSVKSQIGENLKDPSTITMLNEALQELKKGLGQAGAKSFEQICNFLVLDESGRVFLRLDRKDIDYEAMTARRQDKRVLLVGVPTGQSYELISELPTSLTSSLKKQTTLATDIDVVAFNVQEEAHAARILAAGRRTDGTLSMEAMIKEATTLGKFRAVAGASDIYPLRRERAEELYGFADSGYYESLGRVRFVARAVGPVVMALHDGSDQKLSDGLLVYIPPKDEPSGNSDLNPDCHGIERNAFLATHPGTEAIEPFMLRQPSGFVNLEEANQMSAEVVSELVHGLLSRLEKINLRIDHGANSDIASGVFSQH